MGTKRKPDDEGVGGSRTKKPKWRSSNRSRKTSRLKKTQKDQGGGKKPARRTTRTRRRTTSSYGAADRRAGDVAVGRPFFVSSVWGDGLLLRQIKTLHVYFQAP
jgi:hypothetical protein